MLVVPACLAAAFLMGLRVNMTPSLPRGLYIMSGDGLFFIVTLCSFPCLLQMKMGLVFLTTDRKSVV